MVGQIYAKGDARRDAGFTIFYMGINLGAFFAPLICGCLGERVGWDYGFSAAGIGMVLGLLLYLGYRNRLMPGVGATPASQEDAPVARAAESLGDVPKADHSGNALVHSIIGAVVGGLLALFGTHWHVDVGNVLGILMAAATGAVIGVGIFGTRGVERKRMIAIFIVVTFGMFFWLASSRPVRRSPSSPTRTPIARSARSSCPPAGSRASSRSPSSCSRP